MIFLIIIKEKLSEYNESLQIQRLHSSLVCAKFHFDQTVMSKNINKQILLNNDINLKFLK